MFSVPPRQRRQSTGTAVQWTPNKKELPTYQRWFASLQGTSINGDPERLDGAAVAAFLRKSGLESSQLKQVRIRCVFFVLPNSLVFYWMEVIRWIDRCDGFCSPVPLA